ncbi:MAG TPA: hypothetical protein VFX49_08215, partial [Chloroflexota bacterium]|nr:hypothetical protein [Chloroflexota bacterium]
MDRLNGADDAFVAAALADKTLVDQWKDDQAALTQLEREAVPSVVEEAAREGQSRPRRRRRVLAWRMGDDGRLTQVEAWKDIPGSVGGANKQLTPAAV